MKNKKDLVQLVELVKFKLEYIYLIGFDTFGHRMKACVCYVPRYQADTLITERYAYIKSGDNIIFLQETVMDGRFEVIFNPPILLFYAFKEQYVNKLDELEAEKATTLLGRKLENLRKDYSYNPLLADKVIYPWWYTLEHLDKLHEEGGPMYEKNEIAPEDRPILEKVFAGDVKEIKKKIYKSMRSKEEQEHLDAMLIIDANDEIQRKYKN